MDALEVLKSACVKRREGMCRAVSIRASPSFSGLEVGFRLEKRRSFREGRSTTTFELSPGSVQGPSLAFSA